jgi:superfamily II DNA or RNA helicase
MSTAANPLATPGTSIRHRNNPGRTGTSLGRIEEEDGDLLVHVQFHGEAPRWEPIEDLELAETRIDETTMLREGRFARTGLFRRLLTARQLSGQMSEFIYSLDMTNTLFMPHQFKPLLALLDSPSRGVLIADEVGLGKTIEAGLIWTELRFRTNATRLLVVCPAMLVEKWKSELAARFATPSQVMKPGDLLDWLRAPVRPQGSSAVICSLQGLRPGRRWNSEKDRSESPAAIVARHLSDHSGPPLFDLVVIDEAHYLRNEETASSVLGGLLRQVSDYFLLLSATPVNTHSKDLFNLVNLIDPDQFRDPYMFEHVLKANRPLVRAAGLLKARSATAAQLGELLDAAGKEWLLFESEGLAALRTDVSQLPQELPLEVERRVELSQRLERVNLLGQVLVRSRKREVFERRVERKVHRRAAQMTLAEGELYELVSAAVREYAALHEGVEGFLLAMPQHQMASCMYAACRRWLGDNRGDEGDDEFAYEAFGELEVGEPRPIGQFVASRIRGKVDLPQLRNDDSKFSLLLEILRQLEAEHPGEKVLLFSFFRDTLAYLKDRLQACGISCLVVQGGDNKHAAIELFRKDPKYRVMLASEVAAEGVDLQFVRVLVNYDLPWNPMRVEQRIGRIDRIGQEADAISVFNLVYADTIDDKILTRLFQRLRLFEDSIGCTEEVLGSTIAELTKDLLSARLSPDQAEKRIEAAEFAIAQRRKDLDAVEASESDLIGLGDFVRERVIRAHDEDRHIGDNDLLEYLRDFLDADAPGYQLRLESGSLPRGHLKLPAILAADLHRYCEEQRLPRSRLASGNLERIVIRNHVSPPDNCAGFELINQFHPLVRMIAAHMARRSVEALPYAITLDCSAIGARVPAGDYVFTSEAWQFRGVREDHRVQAIVLPLEGDVVIEGEPAFDLLNTLRASGADWVDAATVIDAGIVVDRLDRARRKLRGRYGRLRRSFENENSDRARIQISSIEHNFGRRSAVIEARIQGHIAAGRKPLEQADREQLRRLRETMQVQRERVTRLEAVKCSHALLAEGLLRIRS